MPEADVVRRTATRLDRALAGRRLIRAELRWSRVPAVDLTGAAVDGTAVYGKHLLTRFDSGWTLHTHLRMDGRWHLTPAGRRPPAGPTVRALLAVPAWTAVGIDLGMLDLVRTRDEGSLLAHLGPDIMAADFPAAGAGEAASRAARAPDRPIAETLLDQRVVAGLGTIWVSEALWLTRTWPRTPSADVDVSRVLAAVRPRIIRSATHGDVAASVHGRARRACRRCGTPVEVCAAGSTSCPESSRPIFYCPSCQRPQPTG